MNLSEKFLMLSAVIATGTLLFMSIHTSQAAIVHDGTLGAAGAAPTSGSNYVIMGNTGRQSGTNLFHSFSQFNVEAGRTAWFTSLGLGAAVNNIISRVTSGAPSSIDGGIRSSIAGANLFFINPAGVLFGTGASVEIDGAFHVSTADFVRLGTDGLFHASDPAQSVLTTSPPSAFGFLTPTPAAITLGGSITAKKDAADNGRAISVVGGDITMNNGYLWAPNGTINVAGIASAGEAALDNNIVSTNTFSSLGDITLSGGAALWATDLTSVSGGTGAAGTVYIRAGRFMLQDNNTAVYAHSEGSKSSGGVNIEARSDLVLKDKAKVTAESFGSGAAGSITIRTGNLSIQNGAGILTYGRSTGNAGNIDVNANRSIDVNGTSSRLDASAYGNGSGGSLKITTAQLTVSDNGTIQSATLGQGKGGNISIETDTAELKGNGKISTGCTSSGSSGSMSIKANSAIIVTGDGGIYSQNEGGSGRAGNMDLSTGTLTVSGNGKVSTATQADGPAGDMTISAQKISISGGGSVTSGGTGNGNSGDLKMIADDNITVSGSGRSPSRIDASGTGKGNGGAISIASSSVAVSENAIIQSTNSGSDNGKEISIKTEKLELKNGGAVYNLANASGKGGDIVVSATESVTISGNGTDESSGLYASSDAGSSGKAGDVSVTTKNLVLSDTGAIVSRTSGTGNSGNVALDIHDAVKVTEAGRIANNSRATGAGGNTGDITIKTSELSISENGLIASESAGSGSVGNIRITVERLSMNKGYISSSVGPKSISGSRGGDITINAAEFVTVSGSGVDDVGKFGEYYAIYAQTQGAGGGGTINIFTPLLTVINDGMINADAYLSGRGGSINITVDTLNVSDGGTIVAQTRGSGDAGNIAISASESVKIGGIGVKLLDSWIYTATHGIGAGGNLTITTPDLILSEHGIINANTLVGKSLESGPAGSIRIQVSRLQLLHGGAITADSYSSGDGGNISIRATERIFLGGKLETPHSAATYAAKGVTDPRIDSSGIYARSEGSGHGGDISLLTQQLRLTDRSEISAKSIGSGDAGAIDIRTTDRIDIENSAVTTEALLADGGNISLKTVDRLYLLRSEITATVGGGLGNGGNIFIDPDFVIMNDSKIIANAYGGRGGNIKIIAGNFIADTYSIVDASSQLGIDGTVDIDAPDTDVAGGLTVLPEAFLDITGMLQDRCAARNMGDSSSLFVVGRGGLPLTPDDYLPSEDTDTEWPEKAHKAGGKK